MTAPEISEGGKPGLADKVERPRAKPLPSAALSLSSTSAGHFRATRRARFAASESPPTLWHSNQQEKNRLDHILQKRAGRVAIKSQREKSVAAWITAPWPSSSDEKGVNDLGFVREKTGDSIHHCSLLRFRDSRRNGERQHLLAGPFGLRERAGFVAEIGKCGLQMKRRRIVNLRGDSTISQIFTKLVAIRNANYVLMVNVAAVPRCRQVV